MRQAWPWSARVLIMLRWNSGNCNVFVVNEWQARGYSFLMILNRFDTFDLEQRKRTVFVPVVADSVKINPELDESTNLLATRARFLCAVSYAWVTRDACYHKYLDVRQQQKREKAALVMRLWGLCKCLHGQYHCGERIFLNVPLLAFSLFPFSTASVPKKNPGLPDSCSCRVSA